MEDNKATELMNLKRSMLKEDMAKFSIKLKKSSNAYIEEFFNFLNSWINTEEIFIPQPSDWQLDRLLFCLTVIWRLHLGSLGDCVGCTLLGELSFDKMEIIQIFLESLGYLKSNNKKEFENKYVVIDCQGKSKRMKTLDAIMTKYRETSFVIFNNCENIFNQVDNLRLMKSVAEYRRCTIVHPDGTAEDVPINSRYIFLGKENKSNDLFKKIPKNTTIFSSSKYRIEYRKEIEHRLHSLSSFIHIYDFNEIDRINNWLES